MILNNDWKFLKKPSFWTMIMAALALWLVTDGYISEGLGLFLTSVGASFTVIDRVDRNVKLLSEK